MKLSTRPLSRLLVGRSSNMLYRASPRVHSLPAISLRQASSQLGPRLMRPAPFSHFSIRHNSQLTVPVTTHDPSKTSESGLFERPSQPAYQLTFTCKPCSHRSTHRVSKQGYHKGTVLIQCPSCKNRHVVSDHLKIFMDEASTLDDILREHGQSVKKGRLGIRHEKMVGNEGEEDVEFWDDGSETIHKGPEV